MNIFYFRYNKLSQKPFALEKTLIYYNELTVVLKGELSYLIDEKPILVKAGECLYLRPGTLRERLSSEQAEYLSFNFYGGNTVKLPTLFSNAISTEIKMLFTVCSEIYSKHLVWIDKINKALELIVSLLEDKYASRDENPIIISIKRFIKNNLGAKLTLADISNHVGYSTCHCDTLFKKETGNSIINYLIDERIAEAKRLLEEGSFSLKSIADATGFIDYNYFSRMFKKTTGKNPSEYKAMCKKSVINY